MSLAPAAGGTGGGGLDGQAAPGPAALEGVSILWYHGREFVPPAAGEVEAEGRAKGEAEGSDSDSDEVLSPAEAEAALGWSEGQLAAFLRSRGLARVAQAFGDEVDGATLAGLDRPTLARSVSSRGFGLGDDEVPSPQPNPSAPLFFLSLSPT